VWRMTCAYCHDERLGRGPVTPVTPYEIHLAAKCAELQQTLANHDRQFLELREAWTENWRCTNVKLRKGLDEARREVADYKASFDLYYSRQMEAIKLWQEATGRKDVWPDLGALTEWLIKRGDDVLEAAALDCEDCVSELGSQWAAIFADRIRALKSRP
jgi:hypothetical protein